MNCIISPSTVVPNTVILDLPGDKSISHRAIILGSISETPSIFTHFLTAEDCLNTLTIFRKLGVPIDREGQTVRIHGVGRRGLKAPSETLDTGNSGTGIRLITGVLAAQTFDTRITGDASIQRRPMRRIIDPLQKMGAAITGKSLPGKTDIFPPLQIQGRQLTGIRYRLPVASAQVKSAVLLAGLFADGSTIVEEPEACRDHTERLLLGFGAQLERIESGEGTEWQLTPSDIANPTPDIPVRIPADFSSAAFFLVLGALAGPITVSAVGLNPTRSTLLDVLSRMGADIAVTDVGGESFEPYGTLTLSPSSLANTEVSGAEIPFLIDEIPILAVAGLFASGKLIVRDAAELRVKESDRIESIVRMVTAMGGEIEAYDDGFVLTGGARIQPFEVDSHGDHRIAMSAIIAAMVAGVDAKVHNVDCINTSFPNFMDIVARCGAEIK